MRLIEARLRSTFGMSTCAALLVFCGGGTVASAAAALGGVHGLAAVQNGVAIKVHDRRYHKDDDQNDGYRQRHHRRHDAQKHRRHDDDRDEYGAPFYAERDGEISVLAPYTSVYVGQHGSRIQAPFVDLWISR